MITLHSFLEHWYSRDFQESVVPRTCCWRYQSPRLIIQKEETIYLGKIQVTWVLKLLQVTYVHVIIRFQMERSPIWLFFSIYPKVHQNASKWIFFLYLQPSNIHNMLIFSSSLIKFTLVVWQQVKYHSFCYDIIFEYHHKILVT